MHRDLDGTADELARWDADGRRARSRTLIAEWYGRPRRRHGRWSSGLPLGDDRGRRRYLALREQSAWDVVHERFRHPAIRSFMLWLALATIQDPRRPAPGSCPRPSRPAGCRFGWATPIWVGRAPCRPP